MADLYLVRTVQGLAAFDDAGVGIMRKIKLGKVVKCEVTQPRHLAHHRKFFALLNTVWATAGDWPSVDDLLVELKLKIGIYTTVAMRETGELVKILGSISFASMDQLQFDAFYENALHALCEIAGGIKSEALREEVLRQVAA